MNHLLLAGLLLAQLASPRFADRQRAEVALRQMGAVAVPYLLAAEYSPDADVRRRVTGILLTHRQEQHAREWDALCQRWPVAELPWLDSLPEGYPEKWDILARSLKGDIAGIPGAYPMYRRATRNFMDEMRSRGTKAADGDALLRWMVERCEMWNGAPPAPDKVWP